jgi:two-component system chemotaxis response regulator CheB
MSYDLIVVGTSWGGLHALRELLEALTPDFDTPIAVVQHRMAGSDSTILPTLLDQVSHIKVVDADDKMPIERGHMYIGPADYHLLVEEEGLALSTDELVHFSRPSVDVLFESAADVYRSRLVGVLLTGANNDGCRGAGTIRAHGGVTIAQDPATAESPMMPRSAIEAGVIQLVMDVQAIGRFLAGLCTPAAAGGDR